MLKMLLAFGADARLVVTDLRSLVIVWVFSK